jgi:integrase
MNADLNDVSRYERLDYVKSLNSGKEFYGSLKGVPEITRAGIRVSALSLYSDDCWDFSAEFPLLRRSSLIIEFGTISFDDGSDITQKGCECYLSSVKEYFYSLLVDPPSSYPKISTVCLSIKKGIRAIVRFMHIFGVERFSDLTEFELSEFQVWVCSGGRQGDGELTNRTLRSRVYGLSWLYEQSNKLSDGLVFWPFGSSQSVSQWTAEFSEKNLSRRHSSTPDMPDEIAVSLLECAFSDLSIADNLQDIRLRKEKDRNQTVKEKEYFPDGFYWKYVERPKPFPWEEYGLSNHAQVKALESRLAIACYIIIALLSGMRFHEIAHLRVGRNENWRVRKVFVDGGVRDFYFLVSRTNKLEHDATKYSWQTLPVVESALDALEKGLEHRHSGGNGFLFASRVKPDERTSLSAINHGLKLYCQHHDIRHDGVVWKLSTHQFRKKHARLMIRGGLGIRFLQDQLKHYDVEMTRLYGDMNVYAELQQEKFSLSREKYDELMQSQIPVVGGGGPELAELKRMYVGMRAGEREEFLDSLSKKAVIEQLDDGLCMYRPSKALCGGDSSNCRPADCNNSIIPVDGLRRNLLWRQRENNRLRGFFRGNSLKVSYLDARQAEIEKLLSQIDEV